MQGQESENKIHEIQRIQKHYKEMHYTHTWNALQENEGYMKTNPPIYLNWNKINK
jgi:hypothetical protein